VGGGCSEGGDGAQATGARRIRYANPNPGVDEFFRDDERAPAPS
jgi:hypothetical protein